MSGFEPKIVAFLCNWCSYTAADQAGGSRKTYSGNLKIVRFMCSGGMDPQYVLKAFAEGADGVLMLGCHPGDCHYKEGNFKALRRHEVLVETLKEFGVDPRRVRLDWVSASQGEKFIKVAQEMTERIREMGPLTVTPLGV